MRRTLKNSTERLRFIFTKSRNQNGTFLGVFVLTLNFFFSEIEDENEFFHSIMTRKKSCFGVQNQEQICWTVSVNNYVFQGMKICLRGNPFDTSFCRICLLNATLIRLNLKIQPSQFVQRIIFWDEFAITCTMPTEHNYEPELFWISVPTRIKIFR